MNSEVSQLFKHYGIIHITSSRAHPQSNGMVERRQRMLLNFARLFTNDYQSQGLWGPEITYVCSDSQLYKIYF